MLSCVVFGVADSCHSLPQDISVSTNITSALPFIKSLQVKRIPQVDIVCGQEPIEQQRTFPRYISKVSDHQRSLLAGNRAISDLVTDFQQIQIIQQEYQQFLTFWIDSNCQIDAARLFWGIVFFLMSERKCWKDYFPDLVTAQKMFSSDHTGS